MGQLTWRYFSFCLCSLLWSSLGKPRWVSGWCHVSQKGRFNWFSSSQPLSLLLHSLFHLYKNVLSLLDALLVNTLHPTLDRRSVLACQWQNMFSRKETSFISSIYAIGRQASHLLIWFPKHMFASSICNVGDELKEVIFRWRRLLSDRDWKCSVLYHSTKSH